MTEEELKNLHFDYIKTRRGFEDANKAIYGIVNKLRNTSKLLDLIGVGDKHRDPMLTTQTEVEEALPSADEIMAGMAQVNAAGLALYQAWLALPEEEHEHCNYLPRQFHRHNWRAFVEEKSVTE